MHTDGACLIIGWSRSERSRGMPGQGPGQTGRMSTIGRARSRRVDFDFCFVHLPTYFYIYPLLVRFAFVLFFIGTGNKYREPVFFCGGPG